MDLSKEPGRTKALSKMGSTKSISAFSTLIFRAKEKQDVANLLRGSIKDVFVDKKDYDKQMTKEQV